jgi:branched-chain amino acid transport system permease protein
LALALLIVSTLAVAWISRSRFGFGLIAIRENEQAAAVMGVNTTLYKILSFALCSVFAAIAGGIHAYWITYLDPGSAFDVTLNIKMIIMAVFGGAGTVLGPVLGAFVLSGISEILATKVTSLASIFFGIVIGAAVVFMPRGFADFVRQSRHLGWRYFRENIRASRV